MACFSRLLHAKAQGAQDSPDLRLAELDVVQPFDNHPHALERPKPCTKAVLGRLLQNGSAQAFQLGLVQSGRTASRRHRAQRINSAFIERGLPRVHGLPGHAHFECDFGRRFPFGQQSPCTQSLLCRLVRSLLTMPPTIQPATRPSPWNSRCWKACARCCCRAVVPLLAACRQRRAVFLSKKRAFQRRWVGRSDLRGALHDRTCVVESAVRGLQRHPQVPNWIHQRVTTRRLAPACVLAICMNPSATDRWTNCAPSTTAPSSSRNSPPEP